MSDLLNIALRYHSAIRMENIMILKNWLLHFSYVNLCFWKIFVRQQMIILIVLMNSFKAYVEI